MSPQTVTPTAVAMWPYFGMDSTSGGEVTRNDTLTPCALIMFCYKPTHAYNVLKGLPVFRARLFRNFVVCLLRLCWRSFCPTSGRRHGEESVAPHTRRRRPLQEVLRRPNKAVFCTRQGPRALAGPAPALPNAQR